ncbi:MAG TPA: hypothetical protein VFZ00_20735 [Solirubrobacter sp.]|jgi:hypothetical protein|nr:hypothetical protein [Solirubrobacter sp.]
MRIWPWALLGVLIVACGGDPDPDRFSLRTPGAHTGAPLTPTPEATAQATATPKPTPTPRPLTRAERRIVRGWSEALRRGRVDDAARYFSVPALAVNPLPAFLETPSEVKQFNRSLPCGTKLVKIRRGKERKFVIGVFRLTERPGRGSCGEGEGELVAVAFRIYRNHITSWIRADEEVADPTPEPTPAPSVDPNSA